MFPVLMPSSYAPEIGGVEEVSAQLAAGLRDRGHTPLVITNHHVRSSPRSDVIDGVPVYRVPFHIPHRSVRGLGGWVLLSRRSHRQVFDSAKNADVVNVHCVSSNARYALDVVNRVDVPLVVSFHGEISGDATGLYQHEGDAERAWRRLVQRADVVTAPSEHTLAEAERFAGKPFRQAMVIPNGVSLRLFAASTDSLGEGQEDYVLAVGRLVPVKGFDLLVENWHRLPARYSDLRLIVVGNGPQRSDLERLRTASSACDRISLVGQRSREEVAALMGAARAFVLPSRNEAQGVVLLEAMAAGTPVVAARVGGVPETVIDREAGLLFEPDNASSMIERIIETLDSPGATRRRVENGRQRVRGRDWSAMVERYLEAYRLAGVRRVPS